MIAAPDPALIERFRSDLEALTRTPPAPERKLGVAVSGGPDSLALLRLAHAAWPGAIEAATVDHGLRPEAAEEAAAVHAHCATLGVPHAVLRGDPIIPGQERARDLRYGLLAGWAHARGLGWVAVAHHRNDVAESLVMRAARGAGVGGLAAMPRARPLADGILLVRPLLDWSRAELDAVARGGGLVPFDDPSNHSPRYDRAHVRALLATSGLAPERLARAAANLRDAEDALAWASDREWAARVAWDAGQCALDPAGLPRELRRRLALRAIAEVRAAAGSTGAVREERVDRLLAALEGGGVGTMAGVRAAARKGLWRFALAPARRSH